MGQRGACFHGGCSFRMSLPPGSHRLRPLPIRFKLPTTELASTGCLNLSKTCAVAIRSICSLVTLQQNIHGSAFKVINGVTTTPTHERTSPYYFPHVFSPRVSIQGIVLEPNFPIIANRVLVQCEIAKTMRKAANDPPGTRVRRVAISTSDQRVASKHWFVVRFETAEHLY